MQTDLKMQNEINSEDGLNLFWDGGLWCSAKLTVASKHLLSSFNNKVFSLKKGALSDCFLQNICSKNQILTQNFQSSRKAEHFLISSSIADFRKFQKSIINLELPRKLKTNTTTNQSRLITILVFRGTWIWEVLFAFRKLNSLSYTPVKRE